MSFSPNILKAFQSAIGEVSRPCHYVVFIAPPAKLLYTSALGGPLVVAAMAALTAGTIGLMAESASIPGKQLATTPFTMYGTTMKMPYGTLYEDFDVTFMCSKSMVERTFFDLWASFIHNPHNNNMNYLDTYTSSIVVVKVNDVSFLEDELPITALNAVSVWQLENCYPVTIAPQQLSYASDDYLRLDVQFAYRKWISAVDSIANLMLPGPPSPIADIGIYVKLAIELIIAASSKSDAPFKSKSKKPKDPKDVEGANPDAKFNLNSNKK